jgi:hypothetical protein
LLVVFALLLPAGGMTSKPFDSKPEENPPIKK